MSDNPKHQHPVHVIGNVPVRSIGPGDINPDDPVQIVGTDRDGVFWAVPYGAAAKGFDWSSGQGETSVAVVDGITAVGFEGPEVMISEDGLVADPNGLKHSGRVFLAPPESEADRNAALTQELVRDLHQQLTAAIAERDALREQLTAATAEREAAHKKLERVIRETGWHPLKRWRGSLTDAQSPDDGRNAVPAGDGGDGIMQPSTASLTAAIAPPKMGER